MANIYIYMYIYIYVHREREIVNLVHWENSMVCMPNSVGFMVYTVCVYIYIYLYVSNQSMGFINQLRTGAAPPHIEDPIVQ